MTAPPGWIVSWWRAAAMGTAGVLLAAACGGGDDDFDLVPLRSDTQLRVASTAFNEGEAIPFRYTCDSVDISPPLVWDGAPGNTVSFALIADDPDAPGGWVHWVLYDLPASAIELPETVPAREVVMDGAKQGVNDFDELGYGGPCPPQGQTHRYVFTLYALSADVDLAPGATKRELLRAMSGKVLAEGKLTGVYGR